MWVFALMFPLLMGGPVSVEVVTIDEQHCDRVRSVLKKQLDSHRSNAVVTECRLKDQ